MKKTILIYRKNNLLRSAGGVEKVLTWFSNELVKKGYDVHLTTRDKHDGKLFYPIDKRVHFKHFKIKFYRLRRILDQLTFHLFKCCHIEYLANHQLYCYCKKIKPDIAILAGVPDFVDFVYSTTYPCYKIVQFHCDPSLNFNGRPNQARLYKKLIKKADLIQVLVPSFEKVVRQYYGGPIEVIGNFVEQNPLKLPRKNIIIYAARVEPHKGQAKLIQAFAQIAHKYPDWQVHLYGALQSNEYVDECNKLIQENHLENQIFLKGNINNINEKLAESRICAFPSKGEGFSLALTEAMASGLPCIGFKQSPSVNEMIIPDKNGLLAENIDDFSKCLEKLIINKALWEKLSLGALTYVKDFAPNRIIKKWEKIIERGSDTCRK